jgi:hypothetical protein
LACDFKHYCLHNVGYSFYCPLRKSPTVTLRQAIHEAVTHHRFMTPLQVAIAIKQPAQLKAVRAELLAMRDAGLITGCIDGCVKRAIAPQNGTKSSNSLANDPR